MPSLKLARRSASYNAVKKLYDSGELTENLKPFDREERIERLDDVYFKTWTNYKQGLLVEKVRINSSIIKLLIFLKQITHLPVRRKSIAPMISQFQRH